MECQALNLCELFSRPVRQTPHHVAVEHEEGHLTYMELDTASDALASHLVDLGVEPGSNVPLLTSLGTFNVVAILGILKTGACYVPLDRLTWSQDRIDHVLGVVDSHVVVNTTAEPMCVTTRREVHLCDMASLQALQVQKVGNLKERDIDADALACIVFTSGSTGKPKGVMIRHRSVANYAQTSPFNMDVKPGDRVLHILSVAFDASTGMLFSILGNSGTVVPASIDTLHEKARTCTILASTPSILATLFIPTVSFNPYKLVHTILLGGETPPQQLVAAWLAQSVRILNAYGPTETMCASLMQEVEVCEKTGSVRNAIIGRPMAHCPAYVVDRSSMKVIDDDEVDGEIIITGCGLARGYYKDAARTAMAFVDWNGMRAYRTGDMGRWVRGNGKARVIEFRGRSDRTVKNRGFLVNLEGDVEGPIAKMDEFGVVNVCAVMSQGHLLAAVTPRCVDITGLYRKLRDTLSAFQVPDRIEAVDELPLSANGKVDVKGVLALLEREAAGANEGSQQSNNIDVKHSRGTRVAQCMREALGLSQQHCLTGDSNFFELGGNSLAALRFTTLCRGSSLLLLPRDVYASQTLSALTERASDMDGADTGTKSIPDTADRHDSVVASPSDETLRADVEQALGLGLGDVEAVGPMTALQLELVVPTMACDGKNTVQTRRVYDGRNAAMMRSAWQRVLESEPLFRTELVLHLPCGPVQVLRAQLCVQPVQRIFDDSEAYMAAVSNVNLAVGLGQRLDLLRYKDEMTVVWTIHHALIDGYSQALILAQVERAARGDALVPGRSFIGAAVALIALQETRNDEARTFWAGYLKGISVTTTGVQATAVGVDAAPSARAAELLFSLPAHDDARVASIARQRRTTVATLHYVAWALAHATLAQSRIVVVGAVVSGRETQPAFADVVGPKMATLPLVVRLPPHDALPVQQLLDAAMADLALLAEYAWSRPDQIAHGWRPSNLLAEQYGFPVHDAQVPQKRPAEVLDNTAFPLSLLAEGDATFRLVFDDTVYSIAAVSRLRDAFMQALHTLLSNDEIAACPPRPAPPIHPRMPRSRGVLAYGPPQTVASAFKRSATEHADLVALETTTASLTYAELDSCAAIVARNIRRRIPHARVVAIHADGSLNWIIGILGILKAGCAYCPLDPAYTLQRRAVVYTQSGAAGLLLPSRHHLHEVPVPNLDTVIVVDEDVDLDSPGEALDSPDEALDIPQHSDALIVFTSGTTGEPKGVPISNRGLLALQSNREATMFSQPGRRIAQCMSPAFDYCANEILSALLHGGTLVLKDPTDSLAHLKRVDAATLTPSMLAVLDSNEYPNLRLVYATGEPVAPALVNRWAPGRLFYNAYGPAECSICTSFTRLTPGSAVTIGRPIRTARMYILNADLQPVVEPGVTGEIFLAGMQVMRGYVNAPQQSARCVLADPWYDGEHMYRTGDYGTYTVDGCISYIGRVDRQVKLRGFRIELAAIEQTLYRVEPSIVLTTVKVINDTLVAFVKPATIDVDSLMRQLEQSLQPTWVPQTIIVLDDMPMTPNRKIDSRALEATAMRARKNHFRPNDVEYIPKDTLETSIASEWKLALKLDKDTELTPCEDFLSVGGHSILQMMLAVRLSKVFGVAVTTGDIIRTPTIRGQANIIRSRARSSQHELLPLADDALSPLEEQIWRSYRAATSTTTLNIPVLLHLRGSFDRSKLIAAFNGALSSRKILQSNFVESEAGLIRVFRHAPPRVVEVDELDVCCEINTAFDLEHDELIRVFYIHKSDSLLLVSSHAITDLNSIQNLLREVSSLYAGRAVATPRMNYIHAPVWSRPIQTEDRRFWVDYLREIPPRLDALLQLPAPSPANAFEGTSRFHTFKGSLVQRLTELLPLYGVTRHHLAITVVAQALQWLSGTNDVLLGCPYQNRFGDLEQESAGLFLDRLPIRIKTPTTATTTESLLRATREASQQAIAAAIPFREILAAVNLDQNDPCSPSNHPIFQVMVAFHLQNAVESCLALPDCTVRRAPPAACWASGAKFLCMFEWTETSSDEWVLRIEYDSVRVGESVIRRIERAIGVVLEGLAQQASRDEMFELLRQ